MDRPLHVLLSLIIVYIFLVVPAQAGRETDSYDGNIYALYAGNGSLVPPASSIADAFAADRPSILVYYLDDSAVSKAYAPVVSELQRLWGREVELIPLSTDPLQGRDPVDSRDPATYWHGHIPQIVVLDGKGCILLDAEGFVSLKTINEVVSQATGLPTPSETSQFLDLNEVNTEVKAY